MNGDAGKIGSGPIWVPWAVPEEGSRARARQAHARARYLHQNVLLHVLAVQIELLNHLFTLAYAESLLSRVVCRTLANGHVAAFRCSPRCLRAKRLLLARKARRGGPFSLWPKRADPPGSVAATPSSAADGASHGTTVGYNNNLLCRCCAFSGKRQSHAPRLRVRVSKQYRYPGTLGGRHGSACARISRHKHRKEER